MDRQGIIEEIFGAPRALIGMIHVEALPGTPRARLPLAGAFAALPPPGDASSP